MIRSINLRGVMSAIPDRVIAAKELSHAGKATTTPGHTYMSPKKSQNGNRSPDIAAIIFFMPDMLAKKRYISIIGNRNRNCGNRKERMPNKANAVNNEPATDSPGWHDNNSRIRCTNSSVDTEATTS